MKLFNGLFKKREQQALQPEALITVTFDEIGIICQKPEGTVEKVSWADLQTVIIETTADGPFTTDVFWILVGQDSGCIIPMGATGESELLTRLQELPNFDNGTFIEAMGSVEPQKFICWQRQSDN